MTIGTRGKVIAVIGLTLAGAVAFGWFQLQREMRTLNCVSDFQGVAKEELRRLAKAEEAHRKFHGGYTSDLLSLDPLPWEPVSERPQHVIGFAAPSAAPSPGGRTIPSRHHSGLEEVATTLKLDLRRIRVTAADLPPTALVHASSFLAAAVGNLDGDATLDILTIDEALELRVVSDDCRQ